MEQLSANNPIISASHRTRKAGSVGPSDQGCCAASAAGPAAAASVPPVTSSPCGCQSSRPSQLCRRCSRRVMSVCGCTLPRCRTMSSSGRRKERRRWQKSSSASQQCWGPAPGGAGRQESQRAGVAINRAMLLPACTPLYTPRSLVSATRRVSGVVVSVSSMEPMTSWVVSAGRGAGL